MPIPLALGLAGVGLARSLFHKHQFHYPNMAPFSYTPDEHDAELQLLRRRALEEITRGRGNTIDELARSGLLGSSAAFGVLNEQQTSGNRQLEDIDSSIFARRRSEALDQYNKEADFKRQISLEQLRGDTNYNTSSGLAGLGSLEDIGGGLGDMFAGSNNDPYNLEQYLRKKTKGLPVNDILKYSGDTSSSFPELRRSQYL